MAARPDNKFSVTIRVSVTMRPRLAFGRIAGLLLVLAAIGTSAHYARQSARRNDDFHQWVEARPMEFVTDLSKPGEFTVPFRQTCSISHGEAVLLELEPGLESGRKPEEALRALSARLIIKDARGEEVQMARVDPSTIYARQDEGPIVLTTFAPFAKGDYSATLLVESGAPELAGRRQLLYARYQLCGMEHFPAVVAGTFSVLSGFVSLIAAIVVVPGLLRHGFRRNDAQEVPTNETTSQHSPAEK